MNTKKIQILNSLTPFYDEALSDTSTNAVQNKAVATAIDDLNVRIDETKESVKAITPESIGAVNKAGDTMTGSLKVNTTISVIGDTWNSFAFKSAQDGNPTRGTLMISNANRIHFNQQETGSEFEERYHLPALDTGLTADKWYNILTSKSPVTIAQGGTGATTRVNALKNLNSDKGTPTYMSMCYQNLALTGLVTASDKTNIVMSKMPDNSQIMFTHTVDNEIVLTDAPCNYGICTLQRGHSGNYRVGRMVDTKTGNVYEYKFNTSNTAGNGWKLIGIGGVTSGTGTADSTNVKTNTKFTYTRYGDVVFVDFELEFNSNCSAAYTAYQAGTGLPKAKVSQNSICLCHHMSTGSQSMVIATVNSSGVLKIHTRTHGIGGYDIFGSVVYIAAS